MNNVPTRNDIMMLTSIIITKEMRDMGMLSDDDYKEFLTVSIDTVQKYTEMAKEAFNPWKIP